MQENTNKSIAINSLILYTRLAIVVVCGLFYTRFSLQALGFVDYGLYSVVGGIITFIAILNTVMISCSNRFIAIAIGKKNIFEARKTFNVNLIIHIGIAILTLLLAIPLGHEYIAKYVNYAGDINNVYYVYDISILASVISFIGVPYNGLLIAREHFWVFCSTDVLTSVVKLIATYILIDHFEFKLLIYTIMMAVLTAYPTIVLYLYCRAKFADITRFLFVKDKAMYYAVFNFSIGIAYGAVATIAKSQGTALIINAFFTTVMNSAYAVANSINSILMTFAYNIQKSISPQIVKSYAMGDKERYTYLVCLSSRITYLIMFFISIPFMLIPESVFGLWLADTPDETIIFTRLLILDVLIISINAGISDIVFATGKIKLYQFATHSLFFVSIVIGYLALKNGMPIISLFYSYIIFSLIIFIIRPLILIRLIKFDLKRLFKESYIQIFLCTMLFSPIILLQNKMSPWIYMFISMLYFIIITWFAGITKNEKQAACKYFCKIAHI